ncbi:MAG TPA: helix-turn-helix transcriptional regulator [Actinomycetota bacterium]|nr:helix-turn-helix transcriptional regulator [Actinomycetota bacterium]
MPRKPTPEQAFGLVMREWRERSGLSQEALAFACGRHRTYVSLLERGRSSPSLRTVFDVARALGVRPSDMLTDVERALRR